MHTPSTSSRTKKHIARNAFPWSQVKHKRDTAQRGKEDGQGRTSKCWRTNGHSCCACSKADQNKLDGGCLDFDNFRAPPRNCLQVPNWTAAALSSVTFGLCPRTANSFSFTASSCTTKMGRRLNLVCTLKKHTLQKHTHT